MTPMQPLPGPRILCIAAIYSDLASSLNAQNCNLDNPYQSLPANAIMTKTLTAVAYQPTHQMRYRQKKIPYDDGYDRPMRAKNYTGSHL